MSNELDDFVDYTPGNRGGGSKFFNLKKKEKNDEGKHTAIVWLKKYPKPYYRHQFPRRLELAPRDNPDGPKAVKFWTRPWGSHEPKAFYDGDDKATPRIKAARLDRKTGLYDRDPEICPMARALQWVARQIKDGKLRVGETIFNFAEPDMDPGDEVVITAGGFTNMVPRKQTDIPKEMLASLRKDRIIVKDLWKQSCTAKLEWCLVLVDEDAPESGIQVAAVASTLGLDIKREFSKMRKQLGAVDGDFLQNPYPFELSFDPEASFAEMYSADAIVKHPMSPAVEEAYSGEIPEKYARDFEPGNVGMLRDLFEKYATVEFDLDWIFAGVSGDSDSYPEDPPAKRASSPQTPSQKGTAEKKEAPKSTPKLEEAKPTTGRRQMVKKPEEVKPAEEPGEPCEACGHAMGADELVCPGCGAEYADTEIPF